VRRFSPGMRETRRSTPYKINKGGAVAQLGYNDTSGTLYIGHDGTMEAFSSGTCGSGDTAQCYTSLAGVSYPVNS
jgi:hypothetical protein